MQAGSKRTVGEGSDEQTMGLRWLSKPCVHSYAWFGNVQKRGKGLPLDQQGVLEADTSYKGSWGCIKQGSEALWNKGLGFNIQHLLLIICI